MKQLLLRLFGHRKIILCARQKHLLAKWNPVRGENAPMKNGLYSDAKPVSTFAEYAPTIIKLAERVKRRIFRPYVDF